MVGDGNDPKVAEIPDGVPASAKDLFGLHFNFIEKLFQKDGVEGLKVISGMLGKVKVFSLFSGLGGAELCVQQLFRAVDQKCAEVGIDRPLPPQNLLSCDVDASCQKVLSQHKEASRYIVDDMLRFLTPKCPLAV